MNVCCPACTAPIAVPPERAQNPRLKVKCRCGSVFALGDAASRAKPEASLGRAPADIVARPAPRPGQMVPATAGVIVRPARPAPAGTPPPRGTRPDAPPPAWASCVRHPATASAWVCPQCVAGLCTDCALTIGNAAGCPTCDSLCVARARYGTKVAVQHDRSRPMVEDLGTIASYPLRDPLAFVLLALFTWFFGLLQTGSFLAVVLSQGVLVWYGFSALSKVANGTFDHVMPDFSDLSDIVRPMRLGLAALLISYLPLFLCLFFLPHLPDIDLVDQRTEAVAHAQDAEAEASDDAASEADEPRGVHVPEGPVERHAAARPGVGTFLLLGVAFFWKLAYTPVALTVAALSRSIWSTLNPVIGLSTIRSMGSVYWQAAGIYTFLALVQGGLGIGLDALPVPIVPGILKSFVDAYAWLAIGCTLGLAVYKKAPELGWD